MIPSLWIKPPEALTPITPALSDGLIYNQCEAVPMNITPSREDAMSLTMLPLDSTPIAAARMPAETATAHPVELPKTSCPIPKADWTCPPRGDHPMGMPSWKKPFRTLMLAFPRTEP